MPKVRLNGARLWYELRGKEGRDVIAQIHGAGFGHDNFAAVSPLLSKHYRVLDYDMRGYGLSDRPLQHYDLDVWADDLNELLYALGIKRAHIHGTSMGGMIGLLFAAKYPQRVLSLIVGCTACRSDYAMKINFDTWKVIAQKQGVGSACLAEVIAYQALSRKFLDTKEGQKMVKNIAEIMGRNNKLEIFSQACDAIVNLDLRRQLRKIKAPTLVMVGDEDIMTPLHQGPEGGGSDIIHDMIPGSKLAIIKGCGHTFLFERAGEAAATILAFLRNATKK